MDLIRIKYVKTTNDSLTINKSLQNQLITRKMRPPHWSRRFWSPILAKKNHSQCSIISIVQTKEHDTALVKGLTLRRPWTPVNTKLMFFWNISSNIYLISFKFGTRNVHDLIHAHISWVYPTQHGSHTTAPFPEAHCAPRKKLCPVTLHSCLSCLTVLISGYFSFILFEHTIHYSSAQLSFLDDFGGGSWWWAQQEVPVVLGTLWPGGQWLVGNNSCDSTLTEGSFIACARCKVFLCHIHQ